MLAQKAAGIVPGVMGKNVEKVYRKTLIALLEASHITDDLLAGLAP